MKCQYLMTCLVLVLSGCGSGQDKQPVQSGPESSQQTAEAIRDLSDRLGVPSGEIEVVKESSVTWRDGSLGCPKEGMMYTQALVEGTLIVLRVDGQELPVPRRQGPPAFLCAKTRRSPRLKLEASPGLIFPSLQNRSTHSAVRAAGR